MKLLEKGYESLEPQKDIKDQESDYNLFNNMFPNLLYEILSFLEFCKDEG